MPDFPYDRLRRWPDVEAPELRAWDATDRLLVERGVEEAARLGLAASEIAVIGDRYGALVLPLLAALGPGVRVHQDLVTGRLALARNAADIGIEGVAPRELDRALLAGARLVLLQLPKGLAELVEIADAVARWAAPDVLLIAGGRVKHMTLGQNEVLGSRFESVRAQRAERKSRLLVAEGARPVPADPPFPTRAEHRHPPGGVSLVLCAHGGAFAGDRLDIGTRVLLESMVEDGLEPPGPAVVDLGCGTGALAAWHALRHADAEVVATDRSAAAVRSARATMAANGVAERVRAELDDAGSALPAGGTDLVLLNPPFHLGASVHEGAGRRLIDAAARLLRPGGEVWTVFNSPLDHRRALASAVGPTSQMRRTPKFTVTRSVRH
ncbi:MULTISPECIES: class I SAM-dependent methyltransferase [Bacteria]|uniref:class I SAM-dependent methyltransferase n=1 Tax=Bacteria TaxID=2 RepID=UPI003C7B4E02